MHVDTVKFLFQGKSGVPMDCITVEKGKFCASKFARFEELFLFLFFALCILGGIHDLKMPLRSDNCMLLAHRP